MKTIHTSILVAISALSLGLAGCGDDEQAHGESIEEEFCEHMQTGPDVSVTAAETTDMAMDVSMEHTRYDVALVGENDMNGGFVAYAASEAGDHVIAINNQAVGVRVFDAQMNEVMAEATTGNDVCTEVVEQRTYEFAVGTYHIQFGPSPELGISVVIEHAEHEE